jgi:tetratricopeptide (TPR) repeat protein
MRRRCVLLVVVLQIGCAARSTHAPPAQNWRDIAARADALVRQGCYRCLEEAESEYARGLARRSTRQAAAYGQRLAQLLLAARARELGLVGIPDWEARARQGAETTALDSLERLYVSILPHMGRAPASAMAEVYEHERADADRSRSDVFAQARLTLAPRLECDPVAAYFLMVLACTYGSEAPVQGDAVSPATGAIPLVAYRIGACSRSDTASLDAALAAVPRFSDVEYFKGQHALWSGQLLKAERAFAAAATAFPDAPPPLMGQAQVAMLLEEYDTARAAFERVLARVPGQREALLGRTRALSYLGESVAAEASADTMLQLGTWYIGEAYYWRAWNRRRLGKLPEAAADIESAKQTLLNASVPKLAGLIALDRSELDHALDELTTSRERNSGDCDVHTALGQVQARRAVWGAAGDHFVAAADCARQAQAAIVNRLAEIDAAPLDQPRRDRFRARAERDRVAAYEQEGISSLNAARSFALANRDTDARRWANQAAAWPAWTKSAHEILAHLQ